MIRKILRDWLDIGSVEYDVRRVEEKVRWLEKKVIEQEDGIKKLKHPGPTYQDRVLGALLKHLKLGIKYEQVPDPSRMPEPPPTVEVLKVYKL